jgi:hypothetical protein
MMNLDDALDAVMAARSSRRDYLAASDWLTDVDVDEVEALEVDFEARFEQALARARQRLGLPAYDDESARDTVDEWYPEASRFAGWPHQDGLVFLALEHHDRDTPIGLLVGYATQDEIDELSA